MATYACPSCNTFGVQTKVLPGETDSANPKVTWHCNHCGWEGTSDELGKYV